MARGVNQAGQYGLQYLQADGTSIGANALDTLKTWTTLLYQPLGSVAPGSQVDFNKTSSTIYGEMPIPQPVQDLSEGRHFLFLGCRFTEESNRMFVRRILQRACAPHWAVLAEPPTASEAKFLTEQNIERVDLPLVDFVGVLTELRRQEKAQLLAASW